MSIKLSNAQVKALATKVLEDYNKAKIIPAKQALQEFLSSEEYTSFYEKNEDCLIVLTLQEKYNIPNLHTDYILSDIKKEYFKEKRKEFKVPNGLDIQEVIDAIHLSSIDANDLQSILDMLSEKFK